MQEAGSFTSLPQDLRRCLPARDHLIASFFHEEVKNPEMNREEFWGLIQAAREASTGNDGFLERTRERLSQLAPDELISFQDHFDRLHHDAYRWDLWAAAYLIGGGCSDDAFADFRSWLISRGRATYDAALRDPGALVAVDLERPDEDAFLEAFAYLSGQVYEGAMGRELPRRFPAPAAGDPAGEPWEENSVDQLYPALAAKFGRSSPPSAASAQGTGAPGRPWWRFWSRG